jgi:hypothetical protein
VEPRKDDEEECTLYGKEAVPTVPTAATLQYTGWVPSDNNIVIVCVVI